MTTPDDQDQGNIADTGMFRRFVDHEAALEEQEGAGNRSGVWIAVVAIVAIIVIAVVVWLLTR